MAQLLQRPQLSYAVRQGGSQDHAAVPTGCNPGRVRHIEIEHMGSANKITRRCLLATLPIFPATLALRAQQPTFSAGVKVISLFATVRDKNGPVVRNLTKDDFLLEEEARPQTIRYFSQESNLPLTIGLLIDTSGSTRRVLPDERSASFRFLQQVMRQDKDSAFVRSEEHTSELQSRFG